MCDVENDPVWDLDVVDAPVGSRILIGITRHRADAERYRVQISGTSAQNGVVVPLQGWRMGEAFRLPSDPRPSRTAATGNYRLRNPDYICNWTVDPPAH